MFTKLFIKDIYEENLYFHLMMDIIQNPNPLNEKYTEKHHIIPRFIYRDKNIDIDNSDDNIINLSIPLKPVVLRGFLKPKVFKKIIFKLLE